MSVHSETLKNTGLKLRLWGTITGNDISAYAIIEDMTTRKQKLYKKGDEIQNATVKMIFRNKVVLKIGDSFEILEIETGRPDVNAKDKYGVTALIDASLQGQKEIVELLILEGADLNARDNQGNTALMNAALVSDRASQSLMCSPSRRCFRSRLTPWRITVSGTSPCSDQSMAVEAALRIGISPSLPD